MKYLRLIQEFINTHFADNLWEYLLDDEFDKSASKRNNQP